MAGAKTARSSKSAVCFVASTILVFILFLQISEIIIIRGADMWKVKLNQMLSLSQWNWGSNASDNGVITCDRSHESYDICTMNSPTLLDPTSFTLFTLNPYSWAQTHVKIKPYPLKNDKRAISNIKEITLTSTPPKSTCGVTHHSPALVFSVGGYTGNFYHEMNENFIPLFITINSHFPNQDVVLVVTQGKTWWFQKYAKLLSAFSPHHPIINVNNQTTTHCFPSAIIGLIKHGQMVINPTLLPYPKTLFDFNAFLNNAYKKSDTPLLYPIPNTKGSGPHLTLISRRGNVSRVILNQEEVIRVAEEIGFNVHLFEPSRNASSMAYAYNLIHTSHVLLGVHGAGLTNLLFLRPGSVLVQVVPIGLNWSSRTYYGKSVSKSLGLEYIEYKIEANESSLSATYGDDSLVIKDPTAFTEKKWSKQRIYLKQQDVKLDMIRFRKCLTKAYEKAKIFMDSVS